MIIIRSIVKYFCVLIFSLLAILSCKESGGKAVDEGEIEFDAKAIDEKHPLYNLAPSTAILKFKGDKFILEMSTMGMFNTQILCDVPGKTLTQMVKFMNLKQACIDKEKDIAAENSMYKLKFEETGETKQIAGYKCNRVKVSMVNDPAVSFDAYYTKDMGSETGNSLSPYKGIKGMLMQYRIKRMGLEMEFTAKTVKKVEIPDITFEIPAYYKIVSKEEMQKLFNG